VKYLLDTHLLIWLSKGQTYLPREVFALLSDGANTFFFSVVGLWEITIKNGRNQPDFRMDARVLRHGLLEAGYEELPILSQHVFAVDALPPIHKDPFDRLLIAQAMTEGVVLLTADATVAQYPGPVRLMR
jgi:PIN domain nuclease of toxin-antitoxin system